MRVGSRQAGMRPTGSPMDDRAITLEDFAPLHKRFGFTIDAAASPHNARLERYWTAGDDALGRSWAGERVWCNPPYSHPNLEHWASKAHTEDLAELIVMLVPANRTEQAWWQRQVEPYRDRGTGFRVEFLPRRLCFLRKGQETIKPGERPTFGCCLLIWGNE